MLRFTIIVAASLCVGCGSSSITTDGGLDSGADASTETDAGTCVPVDCEIACEHGFERGLDGCEICSCNPAPDDSCSADADCVIARNVTGCCGCDDGYARTRVGSETCLVERRATPPVGCLPDPEVCAAVDCAACEPIVRAVCNAGVCDGSSECETGDVPYQRTCVPSCASHADCTVAADYGSCCGGCSAAPVAFVDGDSCIAERQSESSCAPAPGACDGLGCASPPTDCVMDSDGAVCLSDGTCQNAGPGGACPAGTSDVAGVCVSD